MTTTAPARIDGEGIALALMGVDDGVWSALRDPDSWSERWELTADDGIGFRFWFHPRENRIEIGRLWPWHAATKSYLLGWAPRDTERGPITVAADKSPDVIARDVARRLLPGFRDALAKARAEADAKARRDNAEALARSLASNALAESGLASAVHDGYRDSRPRVCWDGGEVVASYRYEGDGVRMEFVRLYTSPAEALAVIRLLGKMRAKRKGDGESRD